MATAVSVSSTGNPEIDGLLGGSRWNGTVTYSFPDSPGDYPASYLGNGEPTTSGFSSSPVAMQQAVTYAIGLIQGYTNISIQFAGTNGADIAIAQSPAANPTSYAYYPASVPAGGDVWFGTGYDYSQARSGNYYFATALHELGHAFGLKHSQETGGVANVAVPSAHDDSEYTIMSYRSYAGAPLTGYTAEAYGFSQTYMANDILALQTLYGANFATHSENTVYSWSPTTGQEFINGVGQLAPGTGTGGSSNRIFETVWDGNGLDTYDFSNYATALRVDLNPGASSTLSATQIAYLGNGHYAAGNVYNAYLFNGDARSYIDNAIGGSANDSITGNAIANALNGGGGNDMLTGGGGSDTLTGGSGTDTAVYTGSRANYLVSYNAGTQIFTIADQRSGSPDGTDTVTGVENFQFADGVVTNSALAAINHAPAMTIPSANVAATAGQTFSASSLFSATDPDSDTLSYYLYDGNSAANSGHWVVSGTVVPAETVYAVTAAQLAQTIFVAGAAGTSDNVYAMATDGQLNSNNNVFSPFHVNVAAAAVNHAPVLTLSSANVAASAGQTFSAASLFSATDIDGNTLSYYLYDGTSAANSGHWVVSGTVVPAETVYSITAAQLAQTTFVAGAAGTSDNVYAMATDGQLNSNNNVFSPFHVNVAAAVNHAPVLTLSSANVAASAGQTFSAVSLFSATDIDGNTLSYYLYDGTSAGNSGHWVVSGAVVPAETVYAVTAAQLAQTTFVAGAAGTSDNVYAMATDGQLNSNDNVFSPFHVNVAAAAVNHAPVLTLSSANVAASAGQTFSAASLFSATDVDGNTLSYYLYDGTSAANSGHWVVSGTVVPAATVYSVTAAQLAQTTFVAGAAGTSDNVYAMATDGQLNSNNNVFSPFHVNVASASPASPIASATGNDNFVFAPDLGHKTGVDFGQRGADNHTVLGDLFADHFNQVFGTDVVASIVAKSAFGIHPEATVDPLALFGQHATDHGHFVF